MKTGAPDDTDWHLQGNDGEARVILNSLERNLDTADALLVPRRTGYGRELIDRALPYQLNAITKIEFTAQGVRCSVELPLERSE